MKNFLITILLIFTIFVLYTGHAVRSYDIKQGIDKATVKIEEVDKKLAAETSKIVTKDDFFTLCSEVSDAYVKFLVGIRENIRKG